MIGAVFDRSCWHDQASDAEALGGVMTDILELNAGALDLLCSDGIRRRIGAGLMAQAIIEYQVIEMPEADAQAVDVPDEAMRDAA